jgi:YVTN family beta-propeller protein
MDTIKSIPGAGGYRMVYSPLHNKIYSTDGGHFISVIDAINDSLINTIDPSDGTNNSYELEAIVLSPDQTKLYVADESSDAMFVISTANDSVINAVTLNNADEIENMVISPDGLFIYAVDNSDVLKINTATLSIDSTISVFGDAHGIEISGNGQTLYSESSFGVFVINTATFSVIDTISCAGYYLKLNAAGTHLIGVGESNYADITELSTGITNTVTWSSGSARGIISHPDNSAYYISTSAGVYKIDATSLAVTDSSENISVQSVIIVDVLSTGTSAVPAKVNALNVFPNPARTTATLRLNLSASENISVSVLDITGREVETPILKNSQNGIGLLNLDLSELSGGIYICRVICNNEIYTNKIIKE